MHGKALAPGAMARAVACACPAGGTGGGGYWEGTERGKGPRGHAGDLAAACEEGAGSGNSYRARVHRLFMWVNDEEKNEEKNTRAHSVCGPQPGLAIGVCVVLPVVMRIPISVLPRNSSKAAWL